MSSIVENRSINGIALPPAGAYAFDKSHTTLGFEARHMLSKVHGRFTEFDGEVTKVLYSMSVDRAEELAELLRDSAAAARRGSLEP